MQLRSVPSRFGMRGAHRAHLPVPVPRGFRRSGRVPVLSREPLAPLRILSAGWCSCLFREWQLGRETSSLHDRRVPEMRVLWLVGAGLYLLDPVRDRLGEQIDSVSERAKDVYEEASGRVRKASRAITGEDRSGLGSAAALLAGFGVGVALGILFAPASGEQIPRNITSSAREFGGRIRSRVGSESCGPTPEERL
jgi:hypothetical protein